MASKKVSIDLGFLHIPVSVSSNLLFPEISWWGADLVDVFNPCGPLSFGIQTYENLLESFCLWCKNSFELTFQSWPQFLQGSLTQGWKRGDSEHGYFVFSVFCLKMNTDHILHCESLDEDTTTITKCHSMNFSAKSQQSPLPVTPLTLCLSIIYSIIYKSVSNCGIVLLIDSEDSSFHSVTQDWKSTCAHLSVSVPHPHAASKIRFRCRLRAHIYLPNMGLIKYLPTINITISIRIIIRSCQSGAEFCFRETKQFKL